MTHPRPTRIPQARAVRSPLWLRIAFWLSIVIAVAVAIRRLLALARPYTGASPLVAHLDNVFASHAALTLAHIFPALICVLLVPVIVFRGQRVSATVQRAFYVLGIIVSLTAYAMSIYSVGGWTERSAVLFFDSLFLFSLARAFLFRLRSDNSQEHRWQLRSIAILLGIATTRPVMGVFFATARLTHLLPEQFFGIAFWIGFSLNVFAFEFWIRSVDHRSATFAKSPHDIQARSAL